MPLKTNMQIPDYAPSDLDEGVTSYYGFLDKRGWWYIMKVTPTAIRYIRGEANYAANWTGRANLNYQYFDVVF
jgi:hypothetical protein